MLSGREFELFKVRFDFLITCLSGKVRLVHVVGRGRGAQSRGHSVCTSEWSVFGEVVDEGKSVMVSSYWI